MTRLNPYISFKDTTRQAMEFYKQVFGGTLVMNTFKELYPTQDPVEDSKIMHAMLTTDKGLVFMASDTPKTMEHRPGANVSMSLSGDDEAELRGYWDKLVEGAAVEMPLGVSPWGDTFGMMTDRFGVRWMVNITVKKA